MSNSEALRRRHHFVPSFLIRGWAIGGLIRAYFWDHRNNRLACKERGTDALCNEIDLLMLNEHQQGRDALETIFFQDVDTRGSSIRDKLLRPGIVTLDAAERSEFARFLFSLAARHPSLVRFLRDRGSRQLIKGIDNDPEIQDALTKHGVSTTASEFMRERGVDFEDRALSIVQKLTDNSRVGGVLINMKWKVLHLREGTFLLGDRPLYRDRSFDDPWALWSIPLSPTAVFIATCPERMSSIERFTPNRLMKDVNRSTAAQADRFLMAIDRTHEHWIGKYLRQGSRARPLVPTTAD